MFKKVLLAIDFSGPSFELLNAVEDLKYMGLEELVIIHVIRLETAGVGISTHRRKFLEKVERKCQELENEGYKVKILQPVGNPAEEIRSSAEEENVDLILIGSIGEGSRVRELFLGSTVANVVRITKKPVLVEKYEMVDKKPVRRKIFPEDREPVALIATDFSRSSIQVIDYFLETDLSFKRIILLNVIDEGFTQEQIAENTDNALKKLQSWKNEFAERKPELKVETLTKVGVASDLIIKLAEEKKVTMVAISRRGRGLINELLIGSTADPVVRHSARPVLLFKN